VICRMSKKGITSFDAVKYSTFWQFWVWQYTCRNDEYIHACNVFYKKQRDMASDIFQCKLNNKQVDELTLHIEELECMGKPGAYNADAIPSIISCKKYKSAELKIKMGRLEKGLDQLIKKDFKKFFKKFQSYAKDPQEDVLRGDALLSYIKGNKKSYKDAGEEITFDDFSGFTPIAFQPYIKKNNGKAFYYKVDLNKPLEQVKAEVTYCYNTVKISKPKSLKEYCEYEKLYQQEKSELLHFHISQSRQGFYYNDQLRATGLWLWDYSKGNSCEIYEAIRALDNKISLDDNKSSLEDTGLGKFEEDSTKRKLERYYKLTDNCINNRLVLPLRFSIKKTA
jgi:hypothetical protein